MEIKRSLKRLVEKDLLRAEKQNVIHCVDPSREEPAYETDHLYTRLFGKGEHNIYQFTDKELLQKLEGKIHNFQSLLPS